MEKSPFVISEDIRSLSRFCCEELSETFAQYASLSLRLSSERHIAPNVIMLHEKELTAWLTRNAYYYQSPGCDPVIKTRAYSENILSPFSLKVTRVFDKNLIKKNNQIPLKDAPSLLTQIRSLGIHNPHTILDDIIFSGKSCKEIIEIGKGIDVLIAKVRSCVTIGAGLAEIEKLGVDVQSLYHFDKVVGHTSQHNFLPGFPYSGNVVVNEKGEYRYVPYLLPWGKPKEWASVREKDVYKFSVDCISTTISLWEEIDSSIMFFDVPAVIYDQRIKKDIRFIDYLNQCKKNLLK